MALPLKILAILVVFILVVGYLNKKFPNIMKEIYGAIK